MTRETQLDILRRFFALREAHTTTMTPAPYRQRASVYTDPERLTRETEVLFHGRPLVVGLSGDLPSTGDFLATEVAGVPLLLVRGEDAEVRAFLNICRHRGGRVATGRGRPGRAFKCPYHSWAYDLNGDLLGQPLARDAFAGLDRDRLGLVPVAAAERFGVILARVDPRPGGAPIDGARGDIAPIDGARGDIAPIDGARGDIAPIDGATELAGLGAELQSLNLEDYRFFDERSGVFDANWKLIHDTFMESYHIFSLHRDSIGPDLLSTPFVGDTFGPHGRGAVMRREVTRLLELPESEWDLRANASIVYLLFPSAVLNLPMTGHAELWEVYPEPDDPHRSRVTVKFYVPPEPSGDDRRAFWETNVKFTERVVFTEDFDQQQDIHRSLRTGLMPEVFYGRNEPMLIHHHEQVELALAAATRDPSKRASDHAPPATLSRPNSNQES